MSTIITTSIASLAGLAATVPAIADKPPALPDQVMAEISPESAKGFVDRLVSFGTRHTLSDTESDTRGIGAARRWIKSEFERFAEQSGRSGDEAIRVRFDPHHVQSGRRISHPVDIVNVVFEIPGSMPEARNRLYYVIGHYDSRNSTSGDFEHDAPGADDDGSGVAVTMELARVLSMHRFDSTIILMPTAGEEQGLYGATGHAEAARRDGLDIRALLSNDIVGDPSGPLDASGKPRTDRQHIRVFSEGVPARVPGESDYAFIRRLSAESDSPSRQIARFIDEIARLHDTPVKPMLVFRPDRFLRGGDHTPFNREGYAAVRFCEVFENYDHQHQDVRVENGIQIGDLPEFVDAGYLADVARLNAAAIVHLANAPSTPANARIITARLANDTTLRWDPVPEPDLGGYEVVWRETTSPIWQHARDVGNVTEATIDLSKDNWFFGVRSYDREGYRSPVAFPAAAMK